MSDEPSAARADAQTPTGGALVAADIPDIGSSSAWPDRRLDAVRIHQDPSDTP